MLRGKFRFDVGVGLGFAVHCGQAGEPEMDGPFLTEDGDFHLVTEDGASYIQQEAA